MITEEPVYRLDSRTSSHVWGSNQNGSGYTAEKQLICRVSGKPPHILVSWASPIPFCSANRYWKRSVLWNGMGLVPRLHTLFPAWQHSSLFMFTIWVYYLWVHYFWLFFFVDFGPEFSTGILANNSLKKTDVIIFERYYDVYVCIASRLVTSYWSFWWSASQ